MLTKMIVWGVLMLSQVVLNVRKVPRVQLVQHALLSLITSSML